MCLPKCVVLRSRCSLLQHKVTFLPVIHHRWPVAQWPPSPTHFSVTTTAVIMIIAVNCFIMTACSQITCRIIFNRLMWVATLVRRCLLLIQVSANTFCFQWSILKFCIEGYCVCHSRDPDQIWKHRIYLHPWSIITSKMRTQRRTVSYNVC
jgi:hypothetical protein